MTKLVSLFNFGEFSAFPVALVAGFGDGESSAERRARVATQWRDRYGRWVEMGRSVKFKVRLPDGSIANVFGQFKGDSGTPGFGNVLVSGDPNLPDGLYPVGSENAQELIAHLSDEELNSKGIRVGLNVDGHAVGDRADHSIPTVDQLLGVHSVGLADSVSGVEALGLLRGDAGFLAKADGRFPVARTAGDIRAAAREQYAQVFESMRVEHPDLVGEFKNFDEFWSKVEGSQVTTTTWYVNSVDQIPPFMKALNETYARDVLGVEPDGFITFYRNATNHASSEALATAGYASLDRNMAFDYNTRIDPSGADGRYEIKAKPSEVLGVLGLSEATDEYGVTIGPDVTGIPGRVTRVGDVRAEQVAPWIPNSMTERHGGGDSPFRSFRTASNFDFHSVADEVFAGSEFKDFYDAHGLKQGDLPAKFDELYGEGAFAEARAKRGAVQYSQFKSFFVQGSDGRWGLNPNALDELMYGSTEASKNDKYDFALKFLSSAQELTGQPFFVHKGHDQADVRIPDAEPEPSVADIIVDVPTVSGEPSDFQLAALGWYTDSGFDAMDKFFRKGVSVSSEDEAYLKSLVDLIDASPVKFDTMVYRGRAIGNSERAAQMMALQVGDVLEDSGIASVSPDSNVADRFANMDLPGVQARAVFDIKVPAGARMYSLKPGESSYSSESEALLSPGNRLRVTGIEDVNGVRHVSAELLVGDEPVASPPFVLGVGSFHAGGGSNVVAGEPVSFSLIDDYQSPSHDASVLQVKGTFTGFDVSMFSANSQALGKEIVHVSGDEHVSDGFYVVDSTAVNVLADSSEVGKLNTASYFANSRSVPNPNQMTPISDPAVAAVVQNYTANHGSHFEINEFLRTNPGVDVSVSDSPVAADIKTLDELVASNGLLKDTHLFRGRELSDEQFALLLSGLDSGDIFEFSDAGFSSTSVSSSVAEGFAGAKGVVFDIKAPEGQPAYFVPSFMTSLSGSEQEVLLPRDVTLKVLSHEVVRTDELFSKTRLVITVELINGVEVTHTEEVTSGQ